MSSTSNFGNTGAGNSSSRDGKQYTPEISNSNFSLDNYRAEKANFKDDVRGELRRLGNRRAYSPEQIESQGAIHRCFAHQKLDIAHLRQVLELALVRPEEWLPANSSKARLATDLEALQVRIGLHPEYPGQNAAQRLELYSQAVGIQERALRDRVNCGLDILVETLINSPERLIDALRQQPDLTASPNLSIVGTVVAGRLIAAHTTLMPRLTLIRSATGYRWICLRRSMRSRR